MPFIRPYHSVNRLSDSLLYESFTSRVSSTFLKWAAVSVILTIIGWVRPGRARIPRRPPLRSPSYSLQDAAVLVFNGHVERDAIKDSMGFEAALAWQVYSFSSLFLRRPRLTKTLAFSYSFQTESRADLQQGCWDECYEGSGGV